MRLAVFAVAALFAAPASAEVVSAAAGGFTVRNTVEVAAPPERVYAALGQVGRWWEKDHTWSGDAANLTLSLHPGGCFCESLPGGGVEHMRVVLAQPGETLRLSGALGPLQEQGVSGALTIALKRKGDATEVVQTYAVRGSTAEEAKALPPIVDRVLRTQLERFERYVETGRPDVTAPR